MFEKHGHAKNGGKNQQSRIYRIWRSMKSRCNCKSCDSYDRYGGRGIKVCAAWNGSFLEFQSWAVANGYSDDLTMDRIDNDGDYEPANCRWTTYQVQSENRRNNKWIEVNGVTKTMAQWAYDTGIHMTTLHRRYHAGVRGEEFLKPSKPVLPTNKRWANRLTATPTAGGT